MLQRRVNDLEFAVCVPLFIVLFVICRSQHCLMLWRSTGHHTDVVQHQLAIVGKGYFGLMRWLLIIHFVLFAF